MRIVPQPHRLQQPPLNILQALLLVGPDPNLDSSHILPDLKPDPIDQLGLLRLMTNKRQEDVLPNPIALGLLEGEGEGAAGFVGGVLPEGSDRVLEDVQVVV